MTSDFTKIKEWKYDIKEDTKPFWVMRNDLRTRGSFWDSLDGIGSSRRRKEEVKELALVPTLVVHASKTAEGTEVGAEPVFDSGRSMVADDGFVACDDE